MKKAGVLVNVGLSKATTTTKAVRYSCLVCQDNGYIAPPMRYCRCARGLKMHSIAKELKLKPW